MPPIHDLIEFALMFIGAGVVAGLLAGAFGIGGGAVLVPVFYQVFGWAGVPDDIRMQLCVGTSTAVIVPTAIRSFMTHLKHGAVDRDLLRRWIIAVPLGAILATIIAAHVPGDALKGIFAVVSLLVAFRMIFNRDSWRLGTELPGEPARFIVGAGIGLLSGLMGIGGGVLNNTFMTLYGRRMHDAVATSSGVGVLISIPGLIGFIIAGWGRSGLPPVSTGFVNWLAVVMIIPITMVVAPYGARLAHRTPKRRLEIAFGLFMVVIAFRFFAAILA